MYNMCKCCQSCLETIYWHCIEKRFCYDENIALYEEPKQPPDEKNNNAFDNMAFYDNVALIAGRPIFTIEPLPEQKKPIEKQPKATKTLRWWEDVEKQNRRDVQASPTNSDPVICTIREESESAHADSVDAAGPSEKRDDEPIQEVGNVPSSSGNGSDHSEERKRAGEVKLNLDVPLACLRNKSLTQRRMSKSLSLIIDRAELPLIRQSSMPKFYLDTPEVNQTDSSIAATPSMALASPVVPSNHRFQFDLRSVVQMENEKTQYAKFEKRDSRLAQVRGRIVPLKIKRHSSMINISPNTGTRV